MKHGRRAKILLPEELEAAVEAKIEALAEEIKPTTELEGIAVREIAVASTRLDHSLEISFHDLRRCLERYVLTWDDDQRRLVMDLAAKLPKDPARVARAIEETRHGADFLIENWTDLRDIARTNGGWDEDQRSLALDLLGVPRVLRKGTCRLPLGDDAAGLVALAEREVARLRAKKARSLDAMDELMRSSATAGMPMYEDPLTRQYRRYETDSRRALGRALAELRRIREGAYAGGVAGGMPEGQSASGSGKGSKRETKAGAGGVPPTEDPPVRLPDPMPMAAVDYQARRVNRAGDPLMGFEADARIAEEAAEAAAREKAEARAKVDAKAKNERPVVSVRPAVAETIETEVSPAVVPPPAPPATDEPAATPPTPPAPDEPAATPPTVTEPAQAPTPPSPPPPPPTPPPTRTATPMPYRTTSTFKAAMAPPSANRPKNRRERRAKEARARKAS